MLTPASETILRTLASPPGSSGRSMQSTSDVLTVKPASMSASRPCPGWSTTSLTMPKPAVSETEKPRMLTPVAASTSLTWVRRPALFSMKMLNC